MRLETLDPATGSEAGFAYRPQVLADSPTAYWRLDESSGSSGADSSGHGNTGTYNGNVKLGAPTLVNGDTDAGVLLDGSSAYLSGPSLTPMQGGSTRSVELWFRTTNTTQQMLLDGGGTTAGQAFMVGLSQPNSVGGSPSVNTPGLFWDFAGMDVYLPGLYLADGRAHQVVLTLSGTSARVYVDGRSPNGLVYGNGSWSGGLLAQPFTLAVAPSTAANPLWVGHGRSALWGVGSAYFAGGVDEVAVYDHVLSTARIQAHYGGGWLGATSGSGAATWTTTPGAARQVTITASSALGDVSDALWQQSLRQGASYVVGAWVSASAAGTADLSLRDVNGNALPMDGSTTCSVGTAPALCESSLTYTGADYAPVQLRLQYGGQGARTVTVSHPLLALAAERRDYTAQGQLSHVFDVFGHDLATTYDANGLYPTQTVEKVNTSGSTLTTAYTYNALGQLVSSAQVNGASQIVEKHEQDSWGRVTATVANYVLNGPVNAQTNVRTGFRYDLDGNLTDRYEQAQTAGQYVVTHADYDLDGNRLDQVANYVSGQGQTASQNVTTSWTYDALNRVTDVVTPLPGCVSSCATVDERTVYDVAGRTSQVVENSGGTQDVSQANVTTSYAYDAVGRVLDTFSPVSSGTQLGSVDERRAYDVLGRLVSDTRAFAAPAWLQAATAQTSYTLDAGGRVTAVTGPGTGSPAKRVVTQTDYDDLGRALAVTVDPGALGAVTRHVYDPRGARHDYTPATQQLSGGVQTSTYLDLAGHVVKLVRDEITGAPAAPDVNLATLTAYDGYGRPTDVTDPRGIVTHTDYDALGRVLDTVLDPGGLNLVTSYVYDLAGNRARVVSPRDGSPRVDKTEYDALHRATAQVQNYVSSGPVDYQTSVRTETTYDQGGRALTVKDPQGRVAVTAYDVLGRRAAQTANCVGSGFGICDGAVTSDQNQVTRWQYDAASEVVAELSPRTGGSDGIHLTTGYVYDAQWRLLQVTEDQGLAAQGHQNLVTGYGYDPAGGRLTITDGLSHTTTQTVDDLGRVTAVQDASGNVQRTAYSLAGEVVSTTNGRGQVNAVTLDRMGRVVTQGYLKADGVTAGTITYGWDADGNRVAFADSDVAQTAVAYDSANRVVTAVGPNGSTSYAYYLDGSMKTVTDGSASVAQAPSGVSGQPGNGRAGVSWVPPSWSGGTAITGYSVTASPGGQTASASGTATYAVVSGLTNGTAYTFTVAATTAVGTGTSSAASAAVTPPASITAPGAPTAVTAVAGSGQATISWTAPSSNGGSAITSYTVTTSPGGQSVTVGGSATSAQVIGLTNGTSYTFTVTAGNVMGSGSASSASNAVTPTNGGSVGLVQQASNHQASVTASAATFGSNVTSGNRIVVVVGVRNSGATAQSVTDSGGNTYTKLTSLVAADQTEESVWTAVVSGGAGTHLVVTATATGTANIGLAALEYQGLSSASGSGSVDQSWIDSGYTSSAATVSSGQTGATTAANEVAVGAYVDAGYGNSLSYGSGWSGRANVSPASDMELVVEDQAEALGATPNASAGTGANTTWLVATVVFKVGPGSSATVPGAPSGVLATAGSGQAWVSWTPPASNGGAVITGYTVTASPGGQTASGSGTATAAVVNGLANGTAYTFTVAATNGVGTGAASAASNSVTPQGGLGTTTFTEDALGRLASTQDPLNGAALTHYTVDAAGRLTQRTEADGIVTAAGYSGVDQLVSKTETWGSTSFASWSATYDAAGNPLTEANVLPGDTLAGTATFTYDTLNQLATASIPSTPCTGGYSYDAAHNRTAACGASFGYQQNEALSTEGSISYGSDQDGNQQKDAAGDQLKWDSLSRLEKVLNPAGTATLASYTYDALVRLTRRTDGSGSVVQLVYRGLSGDVVQEKDGTGAVLRSYAWDSERRMLSAQVAGSTYYVLTNLHGDLVGLAQGSGSVAGTAHYDAWGKLLAQSGTMPPEGFQGGWTDATVGFVRMGVRWYYPRVTRFLSSDPAAGTASPRTPLAGQRWLYGRNDPLLYVDPTGEDDTLVDMGVGIEGGPCNACAEAIAGAIAGGAAAVGGAASGLFSWVWRHVPWSGSAAVPAPSPPLQTLHIADRPDPPGSPIADNPPGQPAPGPPGISPVSLASTSARPAEGLVGYGGPGTLNLTARIAQSIKVEEPVRPELLGFPELHDELFGGFWGLTPPDDLMLPKGGVQWFPIPHGLEPWVESIPDQPLEPLFLPFPVTDPAGPIIMAADTDQPALKVHSVYRDGTWVYEGDQPPRFGPVQPDSEANGAHVRLRWDTVNRRVYQGREFNEAGEPVRDIDFTAPTYPSGRARPSHPIPQQHRFWVNDPKVGPKSGWVRDDVGEPFVF